MRKVFLLLFSSLVIMLQAQQDSAVAFGEVPTIFGKQARPYLELDYQIGAQSRDWQSNDLWSFFYGGFLDDAAKAELLDIGSSLRLGVNQSWQARFVYKGHQQVKLLPIPKRSIYLYNRNYIGADLSRDLLDLALNGNRKFAGTPLRDNYMAYENWFYSGLGFQFGLLVDTIPVSVGIGINAVHSYEAIDAQVAEFNTAANGAYIEFEGIYDYYRANSLNDLSLQGLGLSLELASSEKIGQHELAFKLKDFGLAYFNSIYRLYRDSSFRFEGLDYGRLLTGANPLLEAQGDTISAALGAESSEELWRMMPFFVELNYQYKLMPGSQHALGLTFDYLYLTAYNVRSELSYRYQKKALNLKAGLSYGGFTTFSVNAALNWNFASYWRLQFSLMNIGGLVLGDTFNGAAAQVGLRYYL